MWWQRGVVYQVYPRSFQDSDGDGVGDLRGMEPARAISNGWVWTRSGSPRSTLPDGRLRLRRHRLHRHPPDVRDAADFDRLVAEAHRRGIKVILDYVPNHTSDEHPWFVESRSSRDEPQTRLVHLARPRPGWRAAQQLAHGLRRWRLGVG